MKKTIVSAILGLAAIASVQAQSYVQLYSYGTTSTANIVYGLNAGGTTGQVADSPFTVGLYWVLGNTAAAVNTLTGGASTQAGANTGTLAGTGLSLATGGGSSAPLVGGEYGNLSNYVIDPSVSAVSTTITVVLVAYNGASYETSSIRGHSAAFTMATTPAPLSANQTGNFAPVGGFAVSNAVPEPTTFALAGLGLAGLVIFRRRK